MADNVTNHTHAQYAHKGHNHDEYYANVSHRHDEKYASRSHSHTLPEIEGGDALIKSMWSTNSYIELYPESGQGTTNVVLSKNGPRLSEENGVVLVSIKYLSSNGLVDQSLYAVKFEKTPPLSGGQCYSTYNLVKCFTESTSDTLQVKYVDDSTVNYTASLVSNTSSGSIIKAQLHVI